MTEQPALAGRLVIGLPEGARQVEPSLGGLYDLYEQRVGAGRVLLWSTGYPNVLPSRGVEALRGLYAARYPSVRVVADPDHPQRQRIEIDEPYAMTGTPWADLDRILEVTDSQPNEALWTFTVFVSRDVAQADPSGCLALAEKLAEPVRRVAGPEPVEPGPLCIDGASGRTSLTVTVPQGARWFLTPTRDLRQRPITVLEQLAEVGGPSVSMQVQLAGSPVRSFSDGKAFRGPLAGADVEWTGETFTALPFRGEEAVLQVGPDVLWVVLRGRDQAEVAAMRAALSDLRVAETACRR